MTRFRRGESSDLAEIAAIQAASPEAAQWDAGGYLDHDLLVAVEGDRIVGFLASRMTSADERELLNLAVAREERRKGIGKGLAETFLAQGHGKVFLEVRESNHTARNFYKSLGFQEVAVRKKYYHTPDESAIVMVFHSC